jgi:hypothetical protein
MTTISVRASTVLSEIEDARFNLRRVKEANSVCIGPKDDIEQAVFDHVCKDLLQFINLLENFVEFSGSSEIDLSLKDFRKLRRAKTFA